MQTRNEVHVHRVCMGSIVLQPWLHLFVQRGLSSVHKSSLARPPDGLVNTLRYVRREQEIGITVPTNYLLNQNHPCQNEVEKPVKNSISA